MVPVCLVPVGVESLGLGRPQAGPVPSSEETNPRGQYLLPVLLPVDVEPRVEVGRLVEDVRLAEVGCDKAGS